MEDFKKAVEKISGANGFCMDLAERTSEYLAWMQWALGDLPYYTVALGFPVDELPSALGPCILIYLSGRILDDFLDRHYLYRGKRHTLLSPLTESGPGEGDTDAIVVLLGFLVTMNGLLQLAEREPAQGRRLRQMIASLQNTLVGTLMDRSGPGSWSPAFYEHLIQHKNVDYWNLLYDALDPEHTSPLHPILTSFYALAQKLNDLEDYTRDELQGSANIVSVYRNDNGAQLGEDGVFARVEENLGRQLLELFRTAEALAEPARSAMMVKLQQTSESLLGLGFLQSPEVAARPEPARVGLAWYSELEEFVQRLGLDALQVTACPVCASSQLNPVFRKQGFQFNRCPACSHLYVSPRLHPRYITQLAAESPESDHDPFLQSQKIYAEFLCRTLRRHSAGQRLLDVGHGEGHLLMAARALGFQCYGVDFSPALRQPLEELFAAYTQRCDIEQEDLPWGSFDFVVLSHVLEHLAEPADALRRIQAALNPDGLLYVAVPDSESLQFKLLGKQWEAVNPVAHPQFFNVGSLTKLLHTCGFEVIERIPSPELVGGTAERWMKLFRRLGGDETGELAVLARRAAPQSA